MFSTSSFGSQNKYNVNNSIELSNCPNDSISKVCWSMNSSLLAASSWDKSVTVWEVQHMGGNSVNTRFGKFLISPKVFNDLLIVFIGASFQHSAPVLDCAISSDSRYLFSGGCDNELKMHDMSSRQSQTIGRHDAPISNIFWCDEQKFVVTGSWDKTIKFWNGQSQNPIYSLSIPERVYAMDLKYPALVVAAADNAVYVWNLQNITPTPYKRIQTQLKLQPRSISLFPDRTGFAIGSIEGRCAIAHIEESHRDKNFPFRCHRVTSSSPDIAYSINSIDFHLQYGTFATGGSDGAIAFWDKDNKSRLTIMKTMPAPVTDIKFSPSGKLLAYSLSYDWSKGYDNTAINNSCNKVLLHVMNDEHVCPKGKRS
ncbi:WD domain G-beta repeat family protein [Cryptosporidium hominis]|uniref:mRNA export protein n=3 Tax=Cryptosporidium TaxID=5806 RepID=A0A7S7RFY9_CRYPV|nr:Rae1-like protein [Cryptosporidium hominis]PPA65566.1 WD domain G-beta repeat family protein [Cryptosporidium hominis]PPS97418.1 WD40 repeat containing protein [Cryptosporidium hominis]QOY41349.1 Uncharacterized protein with WD40 repeat [Cryptosporidium parvum]|eukprot:QOY41349.1 hypothetical protein CPATCC_003042 [Cryptosporidium parvum]